MEANPEIRTVLIAVDGSEHARKAALVGAMIAARFSARVVLLHVLLRDIPLMKLRELARSHGMALDEFDKFKPAAPPVYDFGLTMPAGVVHPVAPTDLLFEVGRCILETAKSAIEGQGVKDIESVISDDDAAKGILETARKEQVDFVVMGRRGLGALQGMLAGSVSTKVSHLAPATVVSVT